MPTGGTISLTTVFNNIGLSSGNTQSMNQYEFYKGIEWTDLTVTNTQKEFFEKTSEGTRYDWMKQWGSEKSYYENIDDANIDNFKTYYQYASAYFGSAPAVACSGALLADMSNLQVYYKMDSDVTDSSGNGYDGTATAITYAVGKNTNFGSASVFGGTNSYISESSYTVPTSDNITIACWFNATNFPTSGNLQQLITKFQTGPTVGFTFNFYNDPGTGQRISCRFANSTTSVDSSAFQNPITFTTDEWVHACATWNGSSTRLYINGSLVATGATTSGNLAEPTNDLFIGKWFDASRYFDGKIDEVNIWHRLLSEAEITSLAAGTCPLVTGDNFLSSGLNHYYNMSTLESDGGPSDLVGTFSLIPLSGATTSATGKNGNGFAFNTTTTSLTTGEYIGLTGSLGLDISTTAQNTWSGWVNFANYPNGYSMIFRLMENNRKLISFTYKGTVTRAWRLTVYSDTGGNQAYDFNEDITTGTWYHIAFVQNGTSLKVYRNGTEIISQTNTNNGPSSGAAWNYDHLTLGNQDDDFQSTLTGYLDEVGLWDRALGPDEVTELYTNGAGWFYYDNTNPWVDLQRGQISYYALDNVTDTLGRFDLTNYNSVGFTASGGIDGGKAIYVTASTDPTTSTARLGVTQSTLFSTDLNGGGWACSMWVYLENAPTVATSYFFSFASTGNRVFNFKVDPTPRWRLVIHDGSAAAYDWNAAAILDEWFHICISVEDGTGDFSIYINGVERISGNDTGNGDRGFGDDFILGNVEWANLGTGNALLGYMDEVGIWQRSLGVDEVTNIYNLGAGKFYPDWNQTSLGHLLKNYWTFESNSTDSVGGLTNSDTSMTYTAGKNGNAATFDGSSSFMTNIGWSALSAGSIAFWWKTDQAGVYQYLFSQGTARTYVAYNDGGGANKLIYQLGNGTFRYTTATFTSGTYYHIVITWDGSNVIIYVDGNEDTDTASADAMDTQTSGYFGARWDAAIKLDGQLDEFGIWSRALDPTEVTELYNAGAGKFYPFT